MLPGQRRRQSPGGVDQELPSATTVAASSGVGRLRRWLRTLVMVLLGLVLLAELGLRVVYRQQLRSQQYPLIYQPHERFGYQYIPNLTSRICVPSICKELRINRNGYLGPSFQLAKKPGIFRLAVVAASEGTGIWLDGDASYPILLQEHLDRHGLPVEVLNFSVDGNYRELENVRLIRESVLDYEPDLVLLDTSLPFLYTDVRRDLYRGYVLIYEGDVAGSRDTCRQVVDEIERHRLLIWCYRLSYIVRAGVRFTLSRYDPPHEYEIRAFIRRRYQDRRLQALPYSVKRSVRELEQVRADLAATGGKLLLFRYWPNEEHRRFVEHFHLPYLELQVDKDKSTVHRHDGHFNSRGHRLIAEQLYAGLTAGGHLGKAMAAARPSPPIRQQPPTQLASRAEGDQ